uniref:Putative NAC domain class transcription factor n=1 Tax=Tamarix hispida TaxID=189793 RepID=T2C9W6_9CARY|nr:putative NAC domain class transcription factor [Tamarix hispida]
MGDNNAYGLPPGFRFFPTDEEIVVNFLYQKAARMPCYPDVNIPDLHLHPYDPWELEGKALSEGNKWYYYSRRTKNRTTENGYWKSMDVDEPVLSTGNNSRTVGVKRYLVFHLGQPPNGAWTNWIMHEYRLLDDAASTTSTNTTTSTSSSSRRRSHRKPPDYSKWVFCKVYESTSDVGSSGGGGDDDDGGTELSCLDEVFLSTDDLDEISLPNY